MVKHTQAIRRLFPTNCLSIDIVVFDVDTAIENVKLAILEQLKLQVFFALSQSWCVWEGQIRKFSCILVPCMV